MFALLEISMTWFYILHRNDINRIIFQVTLFLNIGRHVLVIKCLFFVSIGMVGSSLTSKSNSSSQHGGNNSSKMISSRLSWWRKRRNSLQATKKSSIFNPLTIPATTNGKMLNIENWIRRYLPRTSTHWCLLKYLILVASSLHCLKFMHFPLFIRKLSYMLPNKASTFFISVLKIAQDSDLIWTTI